MLKLNEALFLIRVDAQFPVGLNLTSTRFWEGWDSVPFREVRGLGNRVEMCGWQLVVGGPKLLSGGLGNTPEDATACALGLALRQVSQSFNAARVEYLRVREYPWFYLGSVAVYPQAIQQGPSAIGLQSDAALVSSFKVPCTIEDRPVI